MFHTKVSPAAIQKLADQVVESYRGFLASYQNSKIVDDDDRNGQIELFTRFDHTVNAPSHLNWREIRQLKQAVSDALSINCEKLYAHQFRRCGQSYVIVSAYFYDTELYVM